VRKKLCEILWIERKKVELKKKKSRELNHFILQINIFILIRKITKETNDDRPTTAVRD
jgi:hypothetical protein